MNKYEIIKDGRKLNAICKKNNLQYDKKYKYIIKDNNEIYIYHKKEKYKLVYFDGCFKPYLCKINKQVEELETLQYIINCILEVNRIYEHIDVKIDSNNYYITLYKKDNINYGLSYDKIYFDNFLQTVSYLQGIRKTCYLLELEDIKYE